MLALLNTKYIMNISTKAVYTASIIITKMLDYMEQDNFPLICLTEQRSCMYSPLYTLIIDYYDIKVYSYLSIISLLIIPLCFHSWHNFLMFALEICDIHSRTRQTTSQV